MSDVTHDATGCEHVASATRPRGPAHPTDGVRHMLIGAHMDIPQYGADQQHKDHTLVGTTSTLELLPCASYCSRGQIARSGRREQERVGHN